MYLFKSRLAGFKWIWKRKIWVTVLGFFQLCFPKCIWKLTMFLFFPHYLVLYFSAVSICGAMCLVSVQTCIWRVKSFFKSFWCSFQAWSITMLYSEGSCTEEVRYFYLEFHRWKSFKEYSSLDWWNQYCISELHSIAQLFLYSDLNVVFYKNGIKLCCYWLPQKRTCPHSGLPFTKVLIYNFDNVLFEGCEWNVKVDRYS